MNGTGKGYAITVFKLPGLFIEFLEVIVTARSLQELKKRYPLAVQRRKLVHYTALHDNSLPS